MMDNEEQLITKFFAENKQEFADNGFSERVMRRLPLSKASRQNRIWTLLCTLIGVIFIVLTDGWGSLCTALYNLLGDFVGKLASIDFHSISPSMAVLFLLTLIFVAGYNFVESER